MKKHLKKAALLLITLVFLYFVFLNLDIKELTEVMKQFNLWYLLPLAFSIFISASIRGIIFKFLLNNTLKIPAWESMHLCITAAAMNILLPARAGDIFRACYTGHKYKTDKVKIFGTVMFERIFDIIVIFSLLLLGILVYHRNETAAKLCIFAGICMTAGLAAAVYAYKFNKTDEICSFITKKTAKLPFSEFINRAVSFINRSCNSFFAGFEIIESPKYMAAAILTSFTLWFVECLNYFIVMHGFGCDVHWSVTLFLMGFIALACMVPSASIFIGPYQMAVIAAFTMYGVSKETALAISIVDQAAVIITVSIAALIFLFKHNISFEELKKDIAETAGNGEK